MTSYQRGSTHGLRKVRKGFARCEARKCDWRHLVWPSSSRLFKSIVTTTLCSLGVGLIQCGHNKEYKGYIFAASSIRTTGKRCRKPYPALGSTSVAIRTAKSRFTLPTVPIIFFTMACDDAHHHMNLPAGVAPAPMCRPTAERAPCDRQHSRRRGQGFDVCDSCHDHSLEMLLLEPAGTAVATNRTRLSQGYFFVPGGNPRPQSGVGPPEGGPPLPQHPQQWQINHVGGQPPNNELASGLLIAPPRPEPLFPLFEGFLTRVCTDCEISIQSEIHFRATGAILATTQEANTWEAYPEISCTCKNKLGIVGVSERLCKPHRERVWNDLVRERDENDLWLRKIWRNPRTGQLETKKPRDEALRRRVRPPGGFFRACRVSERS